MRIKHSINGRSVRRCDKVFAGAGTAIQNGAQFRVYRLKEGDRGEELWRVLRGGVADPASPRGDFAAGGRTPPGRLGRDGRRCENAENNPANLRTLSPFARPPIRFQFSRISRQ